MVVGKVGGGVVDEVSGEWGWGEKWLEEGKMGVGWGGWWR